MKYGLLAVVLVFMAGAAWAAKDYVVPHTWRYKITIEIETPEGTKSGSAVREVRAWKKVEPYNIDTGPVKYEVSGEAVVVDLGKRGTVFGLIDWNSYYEVEAAFPPPDNDHLKKIEYYPSLKLGLKADLPYNQPKLVTFKDISDPKSVMLVYEQHMGMRVGEVKGFEDHFTEIFGQGVKLQSMTIEMTDAPVTWGVVDEWLLWLKAIIVKKTRLNGSDSVAITTNNLADNLGSGNFKARE